MFCPACGSSLEFEHRFCENCGTRVVSEIRRADESLLSRVPPPNPADRSVNAQPWEHARPPRFQLAIEIPHFVFLILGSVQAVGIILYLIKYWTDLSSYGGNPFSVFFEFAIPYSIADALIVLPIVFLGLSAKLSANRMLLSTAAIMGLVLFSRALPAFVIRGWDLELYNIGVVSSSTGFIASSLIALTGIFVTFLAVIQLKPGSWLLGPVSGWWRAPLGFFAVVFLMLESPGRVFGDSWPMVTLLLLFVMTISGFATPPVASGVFLGLAIAIFGSILANALHWVLLGDGRYSFSIVSVPSMLALVCCVVGSLHMGPQSTSLEFFSNNRWQTSGK